MQENGSLGPNRHPVSHQNKDDNWYLPRNNKHVQGVLPTFITKLIFVSYCSSQVLKLSNAPRELIAIAHGCVMTFFFALHTLVSCCVHVAFALRPVSLLLSNIFSTLSSVDVCFPKQQN